VNVYVVIRNRNIGGIGIELGRRKEEEGRAKLEKK